MRHPNPLTLCASCLWRCGFKKTTIAEQIGSQLVQYGRRHLGEELFPRRGASNNGGLRNKGTTNNSATSCGKFQKLAGIKAKRIPAPDEQLMHEVLVAYYTMPRPPMKALRTIAWIRKHPTSGRGWLGFDTVRNLILSTPA